jgi:uncharacterized coiled-coil protein SlyX
MSDKVDTLSTYKTIVESGIADAGAQSISRAIDDRILDSVSNLATKADMENLRVLTMTGFGLITAALENFRLSFTAALDTKSAEIDSKIAEMNSRIAETDSTIAETDSKIAETDSKIADLRTAVERSLRLSIQWVAGLVFALMVTIIGAATTIILKFAH